MLQQHEDHTLSASRKDIACILWCDDQYHVVLLEEYNVGGYPKTLDEKVYHANTRAAQPFPTLDSALEAFEVFCKHLQVVTTYRVPLRVSTPRGHWHFHGEHEQEMALIDAF